MNLKLKVEAIILLRVGTDGQMTRQVDFGGDRREGSNLQPYMLTSLF